MNKWGTVFLWSCMAPKTVQTKYGEVTVETPRDRDGSFKPETVKKRETILAEGMALDVKLTRVLI